MYSQYYPGNVVQPTHPVASAIDAQLANMSFGEDFFSTFTADSFTKKKQKNCLLQWVPEVESVRVTLPTGDEG